MRIEPEAAREQYKIEAEHEAMPNGELRFRLRAGDNSGYIRTESGPAGAWQNAHHHADLVETTIVQSGWVAFCEQKPEGSLSGRIFREGDSWSSQPGVPHTLYVAAGTVLHTVKHGRIVQSDWIAAPQLDLMVKHLDEMAIMEKFDTPPTKTTLDPRHAAYVDMYNNMDNIIWLIPGVSFTVIAGGVALLASIRLGQPSMAIAPQAVANLLALGAIVIAVLCFLSLYSMARVRLHHTRLGRCIRDMEREAGLENHSYFLLRERTISRSHLPTAPTLFIAVLWAIFFAGAACGAGLLLRVPQLMVFFGLQ